MKKKLLVIFIALLVACAFVLAACGGGSDKTTKIKVTLDPNGGTIDGSKAPLVVDHTKGTKYKPSANYVMVHEDENYKFAGWTATKDDASTEFKEKILNSNQTLYALWEIPENDSVSAMLINMIDSIDNTIATLGEADEGLYAGGSLFAEFGTTRVDVTIKGNFDSEVAANNAGYIKLTVDTDTTDAVAGRDWLSLFVMNNIVYVGDGFTCDEGDINWLMLSLAQSDSFISHYFAQLPALLSGALNGSGFGGLGALEILGAPLVDLIDGAGMFINGMFETEIPEAAQLGQMADGDYSTKLDLTNISGILSAVSGLGLNINELLEGLGPDIKGIIDAVVMVLFGGDLDSFISGSLETYPVITLDMAIKNSMLNKLILSYIFGDTVVRFGLSELEVSSTAKTVKTNLNSAGADGVFTADDRANMKKADELVVKTVVTLDLPVREETFTMEIYVKPYIDLKINDDSVVYVSFDRFEVFGFAKDKNGEYIGLDFQYVPSTTDEGMIYFDLSGILTIFNAGTSDDYKFSTTPSGLWDILTGKVADGEIIPIDNAEKTDEEKLAESTNLIDRIYNMVVDIIDSGDIMGAMGLLGIATEEGGILDTIIEIVELAIDEDLQMLTLSGLLSVLSEDLITGSELIKQSDFNPADYDTPAEALVALADLLNSGYIDMLKSLYGEEAVEEGDVYVTANSLVTMLSNFFGITLTQENALDLLVGFGLIYGLDENDNDNGLGFGLSLKGNFGEKKDLLNITVTIDIVGDTAANVPDFDVDYTGEDESIDPAFTMPGMFIEPYIFYALFNILTGMLGI